jgi:hypothetical protein
VPESKTHTKTKKKKTIKRKHIVACKAKTHTETKKKKTIIRKHIVARK